MTRKETGDCGEEYTAALLLRSGYSLLARNYRGGGGEIDIIAQKEGYICFVEVKTRKQGSMIEGHYAVNTQKQRRIIGAALCYMQQNPFDLQPRFDVCVVTTGRDGKPISYDYLKSAFDASAYEA